MSNDHQNKAVERPSAIKIFFKILIFSIVPMILAVILFSIVNAIFHIKINMLAPETTETLLIALLIYRYFDKIFGIKEFINWNFSPKQFILSFLVMVGLFLIGRQLLEPYMHTVKANIIQNALKDTMENKNIALVVLYTAIAMPIIEEIMFRGTIIKLMMNKYNASLAIVISALVFSAAHLNPSQLPFAFISGLFLGWVFVKTRSLILTYLLHFLNNFLLIILPSSLAHHTLFFPQTYKATNFLIASLLIIAVCFILTILRKSSTPKAQER